MAERTYDLWAGDKKGIPEDRARCIEEVWGCFSSSQCCRKRGHGKDGLYCKQHDPVNVAKRRKEAEKRYEANNKLRMAPYENINILEKRLKLAEAVCQLSEGGYSIASKRFREAIAAWRKSK